VDLLSSRINRLPPWLRIVATTRNEQNVLNQLRGLAPDGRRAVLGSVDRTLRVWDLEGGKTIRILEGHTSVVVAVAMTLNGRRAVSGSVDETVRLWDLESGEEIAAFTGEAKMRTCAAAPDGCTIVAGDESGQVHFLRLVEADETKLLHGEIKLQLLHRKEQVS
jgi:WD40 repeat protein